MNYRHAFHAGNFADVHKHLLLTLLWQEMQRKDTGLCYIDTHAGAGGYWLNSQDSQRGNETAQGVLPILAATSLPADIEFWRNLLRQQAENTGSHLKFYPGSPRIAFSLKRPQDRLVLAETAAEPREKLHKQLNAKGVQILATDGFSLLKSHLPPPEKRALILIDPPYEQEADYQRVIDAVKTGYQRWPQSVFALWYPLKNETSERKWYRQLEQSGVRNLLLTEIRLRAKSVDGKLYGSGLALINCPWQLPARLPPLLDWLSTTWSNQGSYKLQQLIAE